MNQTVSNNLAQQLHHLNILTWVQIWLAIFSLIVLALGIFLTVMNRQNLKKLIRVNNKKRDTIKASLEEITNFNNSSRSESHGGNMQGGNQTVNITTEPARDKDYFQQVLLDQVTEKCRKNRIEINRLVQANTELAEANFRMRQQLRSKTNKPTNAREYPRNTRNRRTQT